MPGIEQTTVFESGDLNLDVDELSTVDVASSAFVTDTGSNCSVLGTPTSGGYNLANDASCSFVETGDLEQAEAMLLPLADNGGPTPTHLPDTGSPSIEQANPLTCLTSSDQRGLPRPSDGIGDGGAECDIRAVEVVPEPGALAMSLALLATLGRLRRNRARPRAAARTSDQQQTSSLAE